MHVHDQAAWSFLSAFQRAWRTKRNACTTPWQRCLPKRRANQAGGTEGALVGVFPVVQAQDGGARPVNHSIHQGVVLHAAALPSSCTSSI